MIAILLGSSSAIAGSASSSAYDASVNLTALNVVGPITLGPINPVGGSAPPSYSLSNNIVSLSQVTSLSDLGLPLDTLTVTTGVLNASASSSYPTPPSATAAASINDFNATLISGVGPAMVTLLSLTGKTIASTSTADGSRAMGSTTLEDVSVSGSLLGGPLVIPLNPGPNTVIFDAEGLEVTLNEQTPIGSHGIMTNAVDIEFTSFAVGTSVLDGNIILSHSQAEITPMATVPEPSTWVELLGGFALLGGLARRRRLAPAT